MMPIDPLQSQASSSAMTQPPPPNQKSLGQTLIYLLAWRLRLALVWLYGQTRSVIGDDDMETWSICFVAELVSTPCYILCLSLLHRYDTVSFLPHHSFCYSDTTQMLSILYIRTAANVPNISQLLVRIYFTKSLAYLPSQELLFTFLVLSRGCQGVEF
jgi:hypothetical protein